jgi:hypothetical protein
MANVMGRTDVELRIVQILRSRVENAVQENGREWAASQLNMSAPGVDAVLWRTEWSVDTAVHVAGLLGVLTSADLDRLEEPGIEH